MGYWMLISNAMSFVMDPDQKCMSRWYFRCSIWEELCATTSFKLITIFWLLSSIIGQNFSLHWEQSRTLSRFSKHLIMDIQRSDMTKILSNILSRLNSGAHREQTGTTYYQILSSLSTDWGDECQDSNGSAQSWHLTEFFRSSRTTRL